MKKIIKFFYGTNIKRYGFWHCLFEYACFVCIFSLAFFRFTGDMIYFSILCFNVPLSLVFAIMSDKYFNKCYQFKKNYNKELLNEKKNDRLSNR